MILALLAAASSLCVGDRCPCTDGPNMLRVLNLKTLQIETTTKDLNADLCQAIKDTATYDPKRNLELQRDLKMLRLFGGVGRRHKNKRD